MASFHYTAILADVNYRGWARWECRIIGTREALGTHIHFPDLGRV